MRVDLTDSVIKLSNLTVAFGDDPPVVNRVSFALAPGDCLGLLGLSGSGKSLTALALLGLLPPAATVTAGTALYTRADGRTVDLLRLDERGWRELRGREISLVFQEPLTALNPVQRVGKQLREAVTMLCPELRTTTERDARLSDWLRRVELPNDHDRLLRSYPHELSGGQRQRLLIALALLGEPRLLIADEPTTALDTITESGILDLLGKLRRELGMSLIFITHDLHVLRRTTERTVVLAAGKVIRAGGTQDVLSLPQTELFDNQPGAASCPVSNAPPLRGRGAGTEEHAAAQTVPVDDKEKANGNGPKFSIQNLCVTYTAPKPWPWSAPSTYPVVRDVSFCVAPGEWVAIVGPSGCGKTTVARCLAGLVPASSGTVTGVGKEKIQLIFQDPFSSLNPRHTVRTILREVLRSAGKRNVIDCFAASDVPPPPGGGAGVEVPTVDSLLQSVGLPPATFAVRRPAALSGGQRQRVAIARALAAAPTLLIADEAVSALDVPLRADVLELLDAIRRRDGIGLLFITHDLRLVRERADRVLIMDRGHIVEAGPADRVMDAPQSAMAKALKNALLRTPDPDASPY